MAQLAHPYLAFWGKAQPWRDAQHGWHPAAYHLLDVAAAADALLDARSHALAVGARLLGMPADPARRLVVLLAALHDLGKFGRAFQAKVEALWPGEILGVYRPSTTGQAHTSDGLWLWEDVLAASVVERVGASHAALLHQLAPAVFGHHGRPVTRGRGPVTDGLGAPGVAAARTCADDLLTLFQPDALPESAGRADGARASWWLSGVLTVADWVGSQQRHFAYTAPTYALAEYWPVAKKQAAGALQELGLVPAAPAPRRGFAAVTGMTKEPSPVQAWAAEVEFPPGPVLVIVEDVTGAGKTEAAQLLVHRLMAECRATGAFWAMPTQATANAMYARQSATLRGLYAEGATPSLVLAHGQSALHAGFRASVFAGTERGGSDANAPRMLAGAGDAELPSSAACAAFLADDRRAALLADVGAGTVDQAVLGVLASRFNTVRLLGLADKVLVLDEAHAYDPYLAEEVATLLRFHAALGGSAVVLSATLTRTQWGALVDAWRDGVEGTRSRGAVSWGGPATANAPVREDGYPLGTVVSRVPGAEGVQQTVLKAASWSRRHVNVRFVRSAEEALDAVVRAHEAGGAVAWIRNTVDECLDTAAKLRERDIEPIVFHARFAQCDRQRREAEVLDVFGKPDSARPEREECRRGRVLIATQVVEQSLDLDFDVLVTDLAPVDLLVQRAGRLWRHPDRDSWRTARGFKCALLVLAPEAVLEPAKGWPAPLLPKVHYVYSRVDVLWRSARALEEAGAIVTPGCTGNPAGLRGLIDAVYDRPMDTPEVIVAASLTAQGEQSAHKSAAVYATLKVGDGYHAHAAEWQNDLHAATRLGDQQTTVRLARVRDDGALYPWAREPVDAPGWKQWALSEMRLSAWRVPQGTQAEPAYDGAVAAVRAEWGRFEQELLVLPLRDDGAGGWAGTLIRPKGPPLVVRYTESEGVSYV